ncbi:rRNA maturation RNase YbeY [Ekhidna sp.]|uniref:rRNA maturation RNase YbeY n=1 Tax=Ekhidna sp. TaxID=2608089 RepID=UPI003299BAF9
MAIEYFTEDIDFCLQDQPKTTSWISSIIQSNNQMLGELSYIFCSDDYLLQINKDHLSHDYYTDIITFDNSEEEGIIESDIFISVDRVKENAQTQNASFELELHRVMIHGILHLLGFSDKTPAEQKLMREKEDACLSLLKN